LALFITFLGASIILDFLRIAFKNSLNKTIFNIIYFVLVYIFIKLLFKNKKIKQLEMEIIYKFKKR